MSDRAGLRLLHVFAALMLLAVSLLAQADEEYLAPEKAFQFTAKMADAKTIELSYAIADGYYMYRDRFAFAADGAQLGTAAIPPGKVKYDENFQKNVETYRHEVTIRLPVDATSPFTLKVTGQGCADKGLCYPPQESVAKLSPIGASKGGGLMAEITAARQANGIALDMPGAMSTAPSTISAPGTARDFTAPTSEAGRIESALKSGRLLAILPLFFLIGLGLSFTPCVLPMVPILSSIIVGDDVRPSRARGLALSGAYSLGMALVYTVLGVAAGLLGEGLSANLQNRWVLAVFALVMAGLSLAMFDVYQLQMPTAIQGRLTQVSGRRPAGRLFGVFVMGAVSALIVGPCVAAPLAFVLLYISQTRDVLIGGSALFAMAIGMSVPLLLVGVSAGTLLPRAGAWMRTVKTFFGVLMLALAMWIVAPVVPGWMPMLGWAVLGIAYGVYLVWGVHSGWAIKTAGLIFAALGMLQLVGVATGGRDPLAPLAHLRADGPHKVAFTRIKSGAELDAALAQAKGKTVLLDFYADWCVSCKEMEKLTFTDARVQAQFANMLLLQADVTANNDDDKALLKRFHLFGPPGIIFFGHEGYEIPGGRVIGFQNADRFVQTLRLASDF